MTEPRPIRTVGELIAELRKYDDYLPVRAREAAGQDDEFLVGVTEHPDGPGVVTIVHMPLPRK